MPSQLRRSKLEVCLDILEALARRSMGLTRLSMEVNVNYVSLKRYMELLLDQGLVKEAVSGEGRHIYHITERGLTALSYFVKLKNLLAVERMAARSA